MKAFRRPHMPSRQVYLTGCLDLIRQLAERGVRTELRWILARPGVLGNEIVDRHAKEAAQGQDCVKRLRRYWCIYAPGALASVRT